jgi:hypothetical protein
MRYGIFSDTHANIEALTAVLRAYESERVDRYVCLGDTVGYGASPNECCDAIRGVAAFTILGNHDAAVAGRMDYSYYYDAARNALDMHANQLSDPNMRWLRELPYASAISASVTARRSTWRSSSTSSRPSKRPAVSRSGISSRPSPSSGTRTCARRSR